MVKNTIFVRDYLNELLDSLKEVSESISINEKVNDTVVQSIDIYYIYHFYDRAYISLLRNHVWNVINKKYITINSFHRIDIRKRKLVANMLMFDLNRKFTKSGMLR